MNVSIYSREEIERLIKEGFPKNVAVISFLDPALRGTEKDYRPVNYVGNTNRVYYVEIDDLDIDSLPRYNLDYEDFFPEADELAEYISECVREKSDIICQCEYGQSRSAGCAAAILEFYERRGIDIFTDYRYCPSLLVYHKVYDALVRSYRDDRHA